MTTLSDRHCQPKVTRLTGEAARALLAHLPGWNIEGDTLARTYAFPDFHQTMAFVNLVAFIAHREDHHPELAVSFNRCKVAYNTHSVGGLSENDFICAARIDQASRA
ncbi:MAG: 4a-hydroxytetrahydrobiopterin dehydratase [Burkholderiales bacterium]